MARPNPWNLRLCCLTWSGDVVRGRGPWTWPMGFRRRPVTGEMTPEDPVGAVLSPDPCEGEAESEKGGTITEAEVGGTRSAEASRSWTGGNSCSWSLQGSRPVDPVMLAQRGCLGSGLRLRGIAFSSFGPRGSSARRVLPEPPAWGCCHQSPEWQALREGWGTEEQEGWARDPPNTSEACCRPASVCRKPGPLHKLIS